MTATFDMMSDTDQHRGARLRAWSCGARGIVSRASGALFVLAAVGLWLEPGAQEAMDLLLIKLGVSLFMGFVGLALIQDKPTTLAPEVQIDTMRGEVRIAQPVGPARRIAIRDLGRAEAVGDVIRLTAANGAFLAAVSLPDPDAWSRLHGALRDAGKL